MISKRLKHDVTVDVGAGMSANTGGAVGVMPTLDYAGSSK